jgi:SAM-dependent methyltransferase
MPISNSWKNIWEKSSPNKEAKYIKRETAYTEVFNKYFKAKDRVLEAGSGLGRYCFYFAKRGINIYGIEIDKKSLNRAIKYKNDHKLDIDFREGDIRKLPYKSNFFDGLISIGVIEHFYKEKEVQKVFKETHRVLKHGGYAFFSVPNPYALTFWLPKITRKERVFHKAVFIKDIKKYCKDVKLDIVSIKYRDFVHPLYALNVWFTKKDNDDKYNKYKKIFKNGENIKFLNTFCAGIHLIVRKPK